MGGLWALMRAWQNTFFGSIEILTTNTFQFNKNTFQFKFLWTLEWAWKVRMGVANC